MRNIFFLLFLLPVITYAQSAMSLDECIRLAWKQNPSIRNSAINIKEARTDYAAAIGTFLPRIVANAETGKRFGRSIDPDTNGYTEKTFEEGTIGLDMTLSLFEGFSRINQVRFRKINRERSKWELKDRQNELAYQVTDAYYKLVERTISEANRDICGTGLEIRFRLARGKSPQGRGYISLPIPC